MTKNQPTLEQLECAYAACVETKNQLSTAEQSQMDAVALLAHMGRGVQKIHVDTIAMSINVTSSEKQSGNRLIGMTIDDFLRHFDRVIRQRKRKI